MKSLQFVVGFKQPMYFAKLMSNNRRMHEKLNEKCAETKRTRREWGRY